MKGFIVVTNIDTNRSVCLPVKDIKSIGECSNGCSIEVDYDFKRDSSVGVDTVETFDEVMSLLEQSL